MDKQEQKFADNIINKYIRDATRNFRDLQHLEECEVVVELTFIEACPEIARNLDIEIDGAFVRTFHKGSGNHCLSLDIRVTEETKMPGAFKNAVKEYLKTYKKIYGDLPE